ncbi:RAP protein, putative [Hepatocystis sp. ex Piliocolobus tephrosceles]|nr:RAP protein, putative [Hepatocystis sp. ex Piliocolobus tephrosceles]
MIIKNTNRLFIKKAASFFSNIVTNNVTILLNEIKTNRTIEHNTLNLNHYKNKRPSNEQKRNYNNGALHKDKVMYLIKNVHTIDIREKGILNNISNLLKKHINELNIEEMYLVIHTFSKLKFIKYSLYNNIIKNIINKKPLMNTRTLTQMLLDLHKLSALDLNVLTFFTQHYIINSFYNFTLFDITMILYIFNKYNYNDATVVSQICKTIQECFLPFINEDKGVLTTILLSLTMLSLNYDFYLNLLEKYVYNKYEQFEIKYLCNIAYSIALWLANQPVQHKHITITTDKNINDDKLQHNSKELLITMLNDIVSLLLKNMHKLKNEELKQVHIALYYLNVIGMRYENNIKTIEKKNIKNNITTSRMQDQIEKIFKELGVKVEKEIPVGPYMLDFALKKRKICIEINGFTHYYTSNGKINAKTNLKYFILNKLNWKVVTIEYMDWKNKKKEEKIKYIETNVLDKIK